MSVPAARGAVAALAVLLVGCSVPGDPSRGGGDSERSDSTQQDGGPGDGGGGDATPGAKADIPKAGQCHDAEPAALQERHDPSPPMACSRPHTLETVGVISTDRPITPDNVGQHAATCRDRFDAYVGDAGQDVSRAALTFMVATDAEQRRGEHWLRCVALVASDTQARSAERRTGSLRDAVTEEVPDALRACLNERPRPATNQKYTSCADPHVAELLPAPVAIGAAQEPFPSTKKLRTRARSACADETAEAGFPSYAATSWTTPDKEAWEAGDRTAGCWVTARLPGIDDAEGSDDTDDTTPGQTSGPETTPTPDTTPPPDPTVSPEATPESDETPALQQPTVTKGPVTPPPR